MTAGHGRASLATREGRAVEARRAGVRRVIPAAPASRPPGPMDPDSPAPVRAARDSRASGRKVRVPGPVARGPNVALAGGPPGLVPTRHVPAAGEDRRDRVASEDRAVPGPTPGAPRDSRSPVASTRASLGRSVHRPAVPPRGAPPIPFRVPSAHRWAGARRPAPDPPRGAAKRGPRRRTSAPARPSSGPRRPRISTGPRTSGPRSVRPRSGPLSIGRRGCPGTVRRHVSGPRNPGPMGARSGQPQPFRRRSSSVPTRS
jgi:hypothetical protein